MATVLLPKQRIKDYCRCKHYPSPIYTLVDEEKIDLHKYYTVQVFIKGLVSAEGRGLSKRIAEFKAATNALVLIGQKDPSILENNGTDRYGRGSFSRSFSMDQIMRGHVNRSDSIPSMMSLTIPHGQFSSATASIDDIDSIGEKVDSPYGSNSSNGYNAHRDDIGYHPTLSHTSTKPSSVDEEALSDSLDEGVYVESSESSSPSVSSPVPTPEFPLPIAEQLTAQQTMSSTSPVTTQSSKPSKSKLSRSNFLSSFFILSSLRAISRRSFRRKVRSKDSTDTVSPKAENLGEDTSSSQNLSRPTSSSSSSSSTTSTSSSAFSSNSSISSSMQSSSTSGSLTIDESSARPNEDPAPSNSYNLNLITESIMEEDEEEEESGESQSVDQLDVSTRQESEQLQLSSSVATIAQAAGAQSTCPNYKSLSRGLTTSHSVSNMCEHHHFSIYGPKLCCNSSSMKKMTIESTPTASLLRYCVFMYLPLPYYDIRYDYKFYVTCRVLTSTTKEDVKTLPIELTDAYKDKEFTARGMGETLRQARNIAAQSIIDKLKKAQIYFE